MGTSYRFNWYQESTFLLPACCSLRYYLCWLPNLSGRTDYAPIEQTSRLVTRIGICKLDRKGALAAIPNLQIPLSECPCVALLVPAAQHF